MTNRRTTKATRKPPASNGATEAPNRIPLDAAGAVPQQEGIPLDESGAPLDVNGASNATPPGAAPTDNQPVTDPAVLVIKVPGENPGDFTIQIAELNGLDPFATPNVLKLAVKIKNRQLGLDKED